MTGHRQFSMLSATSDNTRKRCEAATYRPLNNAGLMGNGK
jgi:hypothetical protein